HIPDLTLVDGFSEEFGNLLVPSNVIRIEQARQAVGDDKSQHGKDGENAQHLSLMATKYLKRHGVPPCSQNRPPGWYSRLPPLTRSDTLAMPLMGKDAGSDDGRPQTIVSGFFPRATSNTPGLRVGEGREGSTEPVKE